MAFHHFKRFNKQPATTLTVHRPKPEQLTGRAAHDKVTRDFDTTVDRAFSMRSSSCNRGGSGADRSVGGGRALAGSGSDRRRTTGAPMGFRRIRCGRRIAFSWTRWPSEYCRYHYTAKGKPTGQPGRGREAGRRGR